MPEDGVSPTSASFLGMLILAAIFDGIDIILNLIELLTTFTIPILSGLLDFLAMFIIGRWLASTGKEVEGGKKEQVARMKGKAHASGFSKQQKASTKNDPVTKAILKVGGSFIIEIIPIISFLPMWTFNVISALGKETKKTIYIVFASLIIFSPIILLSVAELMYVAPSSQAVAGGLHGFDRSKLSLYEDPNSGSPGSFSQMQSEEAKNYAINVLGVSPDSIRVYAPEETAQLIRAEVCVQWKELSDAQKSGCNQVDAERGILTYAIGEAQGMYHFNDWSADCPQAGFFVECESNGTYDSRLSGCPVSRAADCKEDPNVYTLQTSGKCSGTSGTLQPLSVTCDKYLGSYNQQVGAFWDIKYAIYLGVKEHIQNFTQRAQGSTCQAKWEDNWNKVYGGSWWVKGSRLEQAKTKATEYAPEDFNCSSGGSGTGQFDPPTNEYGYIYPVPPGKGTNGTYCSDMGTDITVERGTPVMSIADGKIEYISIDGESCKAHMKDQWCVPPHDPGVAKIIHNDGRKSYYAHMSAIDTNLKSGSQVNQGQIIGESGTANYSPHLHISIYEGGNSWSPGKTERLWFNAPYNCPP